MGMVNHQLRDLQDKQNDTDSVVSMDVDVLEADLFEQSVEMRWERAG